MQPNTGFYPGTVLQKTNLGLSLRVLAGKSNLLVLVLSRKGNKKLNPLSTGFAQEQQNEKNATKLVYIFPSAGGIEDLNFR